MESLPNGQVGNPTWYTHQIDKSCKPIPITVLICGLLPFWFRFWQCIYKYRATKLWFPHLVNAGKYTAGLVNIFFAYLFGLNIISLQLFVGWGVFTTLYSYAWDIVMDWGLLRGSGYNFLLRDKLFYPVSYYYFSAITNLMLRFAWLLPLIVEFQSKMVVDLNLMFFILSIAELYRRAQWSLFRVEIENITNYE